MVISNCVLNLVPDKHKAFDEIKRVLKPGGYFSVSDIVLEDPLPDVLRENVRAHAGCVAGALLEDEYLAIIRETGFEEIEIREERELDVTEDLIEDFSGTDTVDVNPTEITVKSMTVRGHVPKK